MDRTPTHPDELDEWLARQPPMTDAEKTETLLRLPWRDQAAT